MIDYGFDICLDAIDCGLLEQLRLWRNDKKIRSWCRQRGLLSRFDQEEWWKKIHIDPTIQMFAVRDGEKIVGVTGLTDIDPFNSRAEFSLYIGPEHQRSGLGQAALRTLIEYCFTDLGLNLIWGESFEGNPAIKMFRELGFKSDGVRRDFYWKGGKFINAELFSIRRDEW